VVADSVRELADRTARAAKSIQSLIEESNQRIAAQGSLVAEVAQTLHQVKTLVHGSFGNIIKVSGATTVQSEAIHGMLLEVTRLEELAGRNVRATKSINDSIQTQFASLQSLGREVKEMDESVRQFKVG
jgi:methyl-accepting chemotaxis protein